MGKKYNESNIWHSNKKKLIISQKIKKKIKFINTGVYSLCFIINN